MDFSGTEEVDNSAETSANDSNVLVSIFLYSL